MVGQGGIGSRGTITDLPLIGNSPALEYGRFNFFLGGMLMFAVFDWRTLKLEMDDESGAILMWACKDDVISTFLPRMI